MRFRIIKAAACLTGALLLGACAATGSPGPMGVAPTPGLHGVSAYSVGLSADPASPVRIGEILSLRLRASAPSYGALYLLRSGGDVVLLSERLTLDAAERRFPSEEAGFVLRAAPPAGRDRLILVGSSTPVPPAGSFALATPQSSPGVGHDAFLRDLERRMTASGAIWSSSELLIDIVS